MKINVVLGHQLGFPPIKGGGVENLNWMLVREYVRRGHQVTVYSRQAKGLPAVETDQHGIEYHRIKGYDLHPNIWLDHLNALRYARRLWGAVSAADVTTFHTPFSFLLRRKSGLGACTHTIHRTPKKIVSLYRRMDRLYGGSNAVIGQALAIDPRLKNLKRIYNCIEVPQSVEIPPRKSAGLTFLYVGRFVPDKGIESLVRGFGQTRKAYPANRLLTVGPQRSEDGADGAFFARMQTWVASEGLGGAIDFQPPIFDRQKLNRLISDADVVCVPTITGETFSMAILEAMALGKPILTSDFPPMVEAVDHKVTGYVGRAGDAGSMADAMRYFSQNESKLQEMGRAAHEKVSREFSAARIAQEYLDDYAALIATGGGSVTANSDRNS